MKVYVVIKKRVGSLGNKGQIIAIHKKQINALNMASSLNTGFTGYFHIVSEYTLNE